jgi:hypothetical protein
LKEWSATFGTILLRASDKKGKKVGRLEANKKKSPLKAALEKIGLFHASPEANSLKGPQSG